MALPRAEKLQIRGPAGALEALFEEPEGFSPGRFGVICHPHPLFGGAMTNKVVHTLARAFQDLGVPTIRFNFRGVGSSEGIFDEGRGETDDALAAVAAASARWPGARPWLAGFSFGAAIALLAAQQLDAERLVTVAPAITRVDVSDAKAPPCPWLIVMGNADELVEWERVRDWAARLDPPPTFALLPGASHFFHGRLHELRARVVEFAA